MLNGKYVDVYGIQEWYKDGKFHREDGPAYIHPDGTKEWYLNGKNVTDDITIWARIEILI